jgi:hypothetical protein
MTPAPHTDTIRTPLQQSLLAPDGDQLHRRHMSRLATLREGCQQHMDSGLAPTEFGRALCLLLMCEAAQRVLSLQPRPLASEQGPAAGLPRPIAGT